MTDWREITTEWVGGSSFKTAGTSGVEVIVGSGGEQKGVSPMEMLLMAIAGCTGIDIVGIMEKKRQPMEAFKINVRALRAPEIPRIWTNIEVEYVVWGDVEPEALEQAIKLSEEKYCSVGIMLEKAAQITSSYKIFPTEKSPK